MSRVPKWKVEKTKIKAVFRLQFQASHVPQTGWDKLFVSFISIETGKLVGKTNKANVKNGNCKWADPVYETTRLFLDCRTKKYDEKIYKLVVSMGTSRSSLLGEGILNLADYADALKPSSVLLPLEGCASGTILHVTVQLLTSKTGFRDFEKQQEVGEKGLIQASRGSSLPADKVIRAKSKRDSAGLPSLRETEESNEDYEDSVAGSYTSDSINTEKSDSIATPETRGNRKSIYSVQDSQPEKEQDDYYSVSEGGSTLAHKWSSDFKNDNLIAACEDNDRLRGSLELVHSSVSDYTEVCSSRISARRLSAETGYIEKVLPSELVPREVPAKVASSHKSEYLKFKGGIEELKDSKQLVDSNEKAAHLFLSDNTLKNSDGSKCSQSENSALTAVSNKVSPSLVTSKIHTYFDNLLPDRTNAENEDHMSNEFQIFLAHSLSFMEEQIKKIQSKAYPQMPRTEFDMLYSHFEVIESATNNVKQAILPFMNSEPQEVVAKNSIQAGGAQILGSFASEKEMERESNKLLKQKISELESELERYKLEQDSLIKKMNQMELERYKLEQESLIKKMNQMEQYYEALIRELEDTHKDTLNELAILKSEHSTCFYTISALQGQLEKLNEDTNQQLLRSAEERRSLEIRNTELGKRAYTSENMLKKIRWNYSVAMDRVQKDLELLSHQVLSMFETNENFAKQAFVEASQLLLDDNPEENIDTDLMSLEQYGLQAIYEKLFPSSSAVTRVIQSSCKLDCTDLTKKQGLNINLIREKGVMSTVGITPTEAIQGTHHQPMPYAHELKLNNSPSPAAGQDGFQGTINPIVSDACDSEISKSKLENYFKIEAKYSDMFVLNVNLDILLKVYREILLEKLYEIRTMNKELTEFSRHLENSTKSNQALAERLQIAVDDARIQKENQAKYCSDYDGLSLQNHILEAKLQIVSDENSLLSERVSECQKLLRQFKDLEFDYNSLTLEKLSLENSLEKEASQKTHLNKELESISEDCKLLKAESTEKDAVIDGLQRSLIFVSERLDKLSSKLEVYGEKNEKYSFVVDVTWDQEVAAKIYYLEKLCEEAGCKIAHLTAENKEFAQQNSTLHHSLNNKTSSIHEITTKLDASNTLAERLQLEVQEVYKKLHDSSEAAKIHTELCKELSSKLERTENKLRHATSENRDLIKQVIKLQNMNEEHERDKLSFLSCKADKEKLEASIQSKVEASVLLEDELYSLRNMLNCANNELNIERSIKGELESQIVQLTSQLNERNEHSIIQEKEIESLSSIVSDIESQKSQLLTLVIELRGTNEEHEKDKSFFLSCKAEKEKLEASIQSKIEAALLLEDELYSLRNRLSCADNELKLERSLKGELENQILQITSQLTERAEHIIVQEKEIGNLSLLVSNLESQKSQLQSLVLQNDECQRRLHDGSSLLHVQVSKLESELHGLQESLRSASLELSKKSEQINWQENEILNLRQLISDLESQQSELQFLVQQSKEDRKTLDSEIHSLKENLSCVQLELTEKNYCLDGQKNEIMNLKLQVLDLDSQKSQLQSFILQHEEIKRNVDKEASSFHAQVSNLQTELHSLKEELRCAHIELESEATCRTQLENKVSDLTAELNDKCHSLACLEEQNAELHCVQQHILALESERSDLTLLLTASQERAKNLDGEILLLRSLVTGLENELRKSQESLGSTYDELQAERVLNENLDAEISNLKAELLEKNKRLLAFVEQHHEYELRGLRITDLESQKAYILNELHHKKDVQQKLNDHVSSLNLQLSVLLENLLAAETEVVFMRNQLPAKVERDVDKFCWLDAQCKGINVNHLHVATVEQNAVLCNETYLVERKMSLDNTEMLADRVEGYAEEKFSYKDMPLQPQSGHCNHYHEDHIREIKEIRQLAEAEMDNLRLSRDELDIRVCILMSKLNEQKEEISLLGKSWIELEELRKQNYELNLKLSEQILKTEEFKILSIHLKELKDKAEADYLQVHERKETEVPANTVHESLRMAFIKEQCETKVQELKTQLHVSKRHGEELLLKLQNALDELEIRKKNEVSHLKRNEELSLKVLDLEAELQKVMSDRRELAKTIDRMKAELECSSISLDCCKEEKQLLEVSLRECNDERTKHKVELDLIKRRLDILASAVGNFTTDDEQGMLRTASFGQLLEEEKNIGLSVILKQSLLTGSINIRKDAQLSLASKAMMELNKSDMIDSHQATTELDSETMKNAQDLRDVSQMPALESIGCARHLENETSGTEQLKERTDIQTGLHFLNSELERIRKDSSASPVVMDKHQDDSELLDIQGDMLQLTRANEQLGNMFPSIKEFPGTRNALTRVLSLEMELAEALYAKKKDASIQSSLMKQHSDEETIVQTFRDINELINEMLTLKIRYTTLETDLKEMHSRYSELSVQFAEVEGEREKLVMTLKNRTPRKH